MKKRLIALLLALTALLSLCACESTGKPDESAGEITESVPEVELNLTDYRFIRPEAMGAEALKDCLAFRKEVVAALSAELPIKTDWEKDGVSQAVIDAPEVLFGNTNRPQTAKALAMAEDPSSFVIALIEKKVVIASGVEDKLAEAGQYFLSLIRDGKLVLPENYVYISEPVGSIGIVVSGKSDYAIVYKDGLDATKQQDNDDDRWDMEPTYAKEIKDLLNKKTGASVTLSTDWVNPNKKQEDLHEILVGVTDREEARSFLGSLKLNEYGFGVVGSKFVIAGYNLTTLELACQKAEEYLQGAIAAEPDGTKSLYVTADIRKVYSCDGWYTDFPEFASSDLPQCMDCGDNQLQLYYENVTAEQYKDYLKLLESKGFTLFQSNEINDNLFAAYTSGDGMVYVYYTPCDKAIRIITAPDGKYTLPATPTKESVSSLSKVTEPKITQMALNYSLENFGACYIVTLSDGSFVVVDGGGYNASYGDDSRLFNLLTALNKRPDGKIVIAGWFLTHEHWDHYTNFYNMVLAHPGKITIEAAYMNTPAPSFVTNGWNVNKYVASTFEALSKASGNPPLVKTHTGMKFYLRDAEFEILFTQDDIHPVRCNYFNESSMVMKMTLGGNTVLFTGDAKNYASAAMVKRFGDYIHTDICTVAHHGYDGLTQKCYSYIKPEIFLWPASKAAYKTLTEGHKYVDDYVVNLVGADHIIIAEPTQTITLPYHFGDPIVTEAH